MLGSREESLGRRIAEGRIARRCISSLTCFWTSASLRAMVSLDLFSSLRTLGWSRKDLGSRAAVYGSRWVNAYDSTSDARRNVGHMTWSVTRGASRNARGGGRRCVCAPLRTPGRPRAFKTIRPLWWAESNFFALISSSHSIVSLRRR